MSASSHSVLRSIILAATLPAFLAACQRGHSAQWYMAHGDAMSAKVRECKADPQRSKTDKDCQNAIEAFVTWVRASGQK